MSTAYTFQSPSVTLEKGAYRMRAPRSTRPGSSLSHPAVTAPFHSSPTQNRRLVIAIVLLAFASLICFAFAYHLFSTRFAPSSPLPLPADAAPTANPSPPPPVLDAQSKYLAYLPHSGLHNQRIALENALVLANLLNRTLVVPSLRLGKPIRYLPFVKLKHSIALSSKLGIEHCPLVPAGAPTPDECQGYREWTHVPWQSLIDLHAVGETIGVRMVRTTDLNISDADTLTLHDANLYDLRFLDTLDDVSPARDKYANSVYIPSLAQAPETLLQIGTLFGSSRLRLRQPASRIVRSDVRRGMAFANPDLARVRDAIYEALGGTYLGVHLRVGDGQFQQRALDNARIAWWKLVHHVLGLGLEETVALELAGDDDAHIDEALDPPLIEPDPPTLRAPHPPLPPLPAQFAQQVGCRGGPPLHASPLLRALNVPLYVATDSVDPHEDAVFGLYRRTFPCVFFLGDFGAQLGALDALVNAYDGVPLKGFLMPVLDAMVLARAREVAVTDGSTFGAFVRDVLWRRYLGLEIVQRG